MEAVGRVLLKDSVYLRLRAAIERGELAPGASLRDGELATQLGVSKAPVRDALARLVDDGLVESKPQSYTRVTPLDVGEVHDATEVVRAMHELTIRRAIGRLTPDDLTAMRDANHRFRAATRAGDVDAAMAADDEFHDVLVRAAGNRAAAATIARYLPLLRRLERRQFSTTRAHRSVERHDRLVAACATGDVDAAVRANAEIWTALDDLAEQPARTDRTVGTNPTR